MTKRKQTKSSLFPLNFLQQFASSFIEFLAKFQKKKLETIFLVFKMLACFFKTLVKKIDKKSRNLEINTMFISLISKTKNQMLTNEKKIPTSGHACQRNN